jgi:hypothetical protein
MGYIAVSFRHHLDVISTQRPFIATHRASVPHTPGGAPDVVYPFLEPKPIVVSALR